MLNNVELVTKKKLCCSCGLCANYCKRNAITYEIDQLGFYKPTINRINCSNCGVCLECCPGINDLKCYEHREEFYYYGYSLDEEMRQNAASGGIATELLCYLIENKIVDYVTCVSNRTSRELPQQIVTNDINAIRQMRQSKYCPVKWNDIVAKLDKIEGKIAIVALPCQINSLKKYYSKRKHNIKFFISLMCNHTPSLFAANYLSQAVNHSGELESIQYRGGGWPGFMKLTIAEKKFGSKQEVKFPFRKAWAAGYGKYFKNLRCSVCNDPFAQNADIVFGDSYFLQDTDTIGNTLCIIRNEELLDILQKMKQGHVIALTKGPSIETINKYYKVLFDREIDFTKKNSILHYLHRGIGSKNDLYKPTMKEVRRFLINHFFCTLGKYHFLWRLLARRNKVKELIIKTSL